VSLARSRQTAVSTRPVSLAEERAELASFDFANGLAIALLLGDGLEGNEVAQTTGADQHAIRAADELIRIIEVEFGVEPEAADFLVSVGGVDHDEVRFLLVRLRRPPGGARRPGLGLAKEFRYRVHVHSVHRTDPPIVTVADHAVLQKRIDCHELFDVLQDVQADGVVGNPAANLAINLVPRPPHLAFEITAKGREIFVQVLVVTRGRGPARAAVVVVSIGGRESAAVDVEAQSGFAVTGRAARHPRTFHDHFVHVGSHMPSLRDQGRQMRKERTTPAVS
jgi:hypothetical protein